VIVRNKAGEPVSGLNEDDFEIFDKGKRQRLASFAIVEHPANVVLPNAITKSSVASSDAATLPLNHAPANVQPDEAEGRRNIIYLFDDIDATFADFGAVRAALIRHIQSLAPSDRAAIYAFSGRPQLELTTSRQELENTAAKLRMSLADVTADEAKSCPHINYYLADLILNRDDERARTAAIEHTFACEHVPKPIAAQIMEAAARRQLVFVPQQTRMALRAIRLAVARLSQMPGERIIILTSPGFFETAANDEDLEQVLQVATHSHVVINALNTRGLYSNQPDATERNDNYQPWWRYRLESFQAAEDVMRELTQATGGLFINNNDGFRQAFDRLATAPEYSYVLGFVPSYSKPDGSFHVIKVRLANQKGLTVQARRGYYALENDPAKQAARFEIDDAVFSRDEKQELPVTFQTGYVAPHDGDPTITAIVKVNVHSLNLRVSKQGNVDTLTVVAAVFTDDGAYLIGTTKVVNLQLHDKTLKTDPAVTLPFAFHVNRGSYWIRLVLRDSQSGAMTTITRPENIS
jgi:VWFA-related protein